MRHLPRIVGYIKMGLFLQIGSRQAREEFIHVDDLIEVELLAAQQLLLRNIKSGEAYFVSNGAPINNFKFFEPLANALGYKLPPFAIPFRLFYAITILNEYLCRILKPVIQLKPFLLRAELNKVIKKMNCINIRSATQLFFAV